MKHNQSFVVDIGETMVNNRNVNSNEDRQILFCKCGNVKTFNLKIKRSLIKNFDELIEGDECLDNIKCEKCGSIYDTYNKICLLTPNKEELIDVKYDVITNNSESTSRLNKIKKFVTYNSKENKLKYREEIDYIDFDEKTKTVLLHISKYTKNDENMDIADPQPYNEIAKSRVDIDAELTLNNIFYLEDFFKYFEFVSYSNLDSAFSFLHHIDRYVVDFHELKNENFIDFIYSNNKIEIVTNPKGETEFAQTLPSGFNDGKYIKRKLNTGNYLRNLEDLSKVLFTVISFPNITTIFLTKGYAFFKSFIHSNNKCEPSVYKKMNATYPTKIIEISTNYDKDGKLKKPAENTKKRKYLKISSIIYKNINTPADMDVLLDVYTSNILTKQEIEMLFQKYDNDRLYKLFRQLTDKIKRHEIKLAFQHILHILNYKLDDLKNDFLEKYIDTIRMIDLLERPENEILKVRNYKELKALHDDYTARYNVIKDEKRAEFYKRAISAFENLTMVVDDIQFTVIPSIEELNKEGLRMQHCIYTYMERICERRYLAINVKHILSNERATAGLVRNGDELSLEQLKGYQNSRATAKMINTLMKFCQINKIKVLSHSDFTPNESLRKRMDDYVSDEKVAEIRKKRAEEEEKKNGEKDAQEAVPDKKVRKKYKQQNQKSKHKLLKSGLLVGKNVLNNIF